MMKSLCKEFSIFKTSFIMPIVLLFVIISLVVDCDPPAFPLPDSSEAIDCINIKDVNIWVELSRLKVKMKIGEFVQYPKEIASSLIRLKTRVGNMTFEYPPERFWDLTSDLENISFCSLQAVGGPITFSLYCQNQLLSTVTGKIAGDINVYPVGWSRLVSRNYSFADFYDVCFEDDQQLVFFSQPKTTFSPMTVSSTMTLPVVIDSRKCKDYCNFKKYTFLSNPTVLIPDVPIDPSTILTHIALPLFDLLSNFNNRLNVYSFAELPSFAHTSLSPISSNITVLPTKKCFERLLIVKTNGSKSIFSETNNNFYNDLSNIDPKILNSFREKYTKNSANSNRIVIDSNSLHLKEKISKLFPKLEILTIDESSDLQTTANLISSSKVFICGHISKIFNSIFLGSNSSLVEIPLKDTECFSFGKKIAEKIGAKYFMFNGISNCKCNNIECYMKSAIKHIEINDEELKKIISEALK
ncbi:hypothetical protein GPJ56_002856 [Histomonas meleagridis]|uniref:uncharacterized protein n=1 Tax=Histomonas meleagridis TaxID=135588 RepID=UPI003559BB58|nr:hypothetical protein GPJ56_002856 [Histomonas meleagridis]KAH0800443.1 hypothetical protein GO595_006854 [Histomonas meleagridis]